MMRSRVLLVVVFSLLMLGVGFFAFSTQNQDPIQSFSATVNRDCAPWDGSAFTVQILLNNGDTLSISIWQAPNIPLPKIFTFPDDTGQVGNASLLQSTGVTEQLTGKVWFEGVSEGKAIEGRFSLMDERGERFEGRFVAERESQMAMCG